MSKTITENKEIYEGLEEFLKENQIEYTKIVIDKYKSDYILPENKIEVVRAFCSGYWRHYNENCILPF